MTIYQIEVIKNSGNKRLIKRIFTQEGNKEQGLIIVFSLKFMYVVMKDGLMNIIIIQKTKVERRFLGI